jgi:nucleotide-binding universal stress UspA family protein
MIWPSEGAGRIAAAHRSPVAVIQVDDGWLEGAATLLEAQGNPAAAIAETAAREQASLIVIGSRGLGRARVLGSVGERLAHEAPCSVLVLRQSAT